MGTAGHIDHGKTTLIRKLTGIDCDTHKEEKQRGITIYLGFSHYKLSNGNQLGIVDVPGHADFVNTMIAGASGMDMVMLVIAADAGIMPQTKEHLQIMTILGIQKGFIVLTKTDLVDNEYLELVEEEIGSLVENTFLAGTPMIRFSAVTETGLPEIKKAIEDIELSCEPRSAEGLFRLYVDRLFNKAGFGNIVTGTVISGQIHKNSKVFLLPGSEQIRIRRMERHGAETNELSAGDRGSINLTGINKDALHRGMLITDRILQSTQMVDAVLNLFPEGLRLKLWSQCLLLHGTSQYEVRIHLLDCNELQQGGEAIVQIHFSTPIFASFGDRFVIRNSSSDLTLGGGEIFDTRPLHHKRRTKNLLQGLQKVVTGDIEELIAAEVRKNLLPLTGKELIFLFGIQQDEFLQIVSSRLPEDIVALNTENETYLVAKNRYERNKRRVLKYIQVFHKQNPLEETGKTLEELAGLFGKERNDTLIGFLNAMLTDLAEQKKISKQNNSWVLFGHSVVINDVLRDQISFVENFLLDSGMKTPLMSELMPASESKGIDQELLIQILKLLIFRGKAYRIDDNYLHSSIVDKMRIILLKALLKKKEGLTVSEFRDLIDGNRKLCLLLLSRYDGEGVTLRKGDYRMITEKGRSFLRENDNA